MSEGLCELTGLSLECNSDQYLYLGKKYIAGNIGRAFSLLSLGLSLNTNKREEYSKVYFSVLESWSNKLLQDSRYQDCLKVFDAAQDIYPESSELNFLLSSALFRLGRTREAWEYSLKSLRVYSHNPRVQSLVSELCNNLVDRWHFPMINDKNRNYALGLAIQKCISEGYTSVLDIGAGSGLLSIYAHRSGGVPVFACEMDEFMCELSEGILKANNVSEADGIKQVHCCSTSIEIKQQIPSRVSLVISETLDAGLFGEHILETLDHAWDKLLFPPAQVSQCAADAMPNEKTNGKVIPSWAEVYVALLECDYVMRQTKAELHFEEECFAVNFEIQEPYLSEIIDHIPGRYTILSEWFNAINIDFNSPLEIKNILNGGGNKEFSISISKQGRVDGLILAYKLHLDEEHSICTFPGSCTCWENAIYPLSSRKIFIVGDRITVNMTYDGALRFSMEEACTDKNFFNIVSAAKKHHDSEACRLVSEESFVSLKTTDVQLLKCLNSNSFTEFYRQEAHKLIGAISSPVNVLDTCDFPTAGLTFLEQNMSTNLFVTNDHAFELLSNTRFNIYKNCDRKQQINVLIFWPFNAEGTLKDNFIEELAQYRSTFADGCKIIPAFLEIHMIGIESAQLACMTRIDDQNTWGVKIAEVFNLVKTHHHLDVPIEGIRYKPLTPIIKPVKFCLYDLDLSYENFSEDEEGLSIGSKLWTKTIAVTTLTAGNIEGFAYWFELTGMRDSVLEEKKISERNVTSCDVTDSQIQQSNIDLCSPQSSVEEEQSLSTLSIDSPINQCVFLLDKAVAVSENQALEVNFAICDGQFSIYFSQ